MDIGSSASDRRELFLHSNLKLVILSVGTLQMNLSIQLDSNLSQKCVANSFMIRHITIIHSHYYVFGHV